MQGRHFLVKEDENGRYLLRELDPSIASAISFFGIITGRCCHSVAAHQWTFYFMNAHVSEQGADEIATQLTQEFLAECR
ncbi:MAG: hypothetical protein WBC91_19265 [Phototrophicaceae bacterium]